MKLTIQRDFTFVDSLKAQLYVCRHAYSGTLSLSTHLKRDFTFVGTLTARRLSQKQSPAALRGVEMLL